MLNRDATHHATGLRVHLLQPLRQRRVGILELGGVAILDTEYLLCDRIC